MQFSAIIVAAFAAVASAQYTYSNGTSTSVAASGTASASGSASASASATESIPFEGGAPMATGAGMALLFAAGGAALMI